MKKRSEVGSRAIRKRIAKQFAKQTARVVKTQGAWQFAKQTAKQFARELPSRDIDANAWPESSSLFFDTLLIQSTYGYPHG